MTTPFSSPRPFSFASTVSIVVSIVLSLILTTPSNPSHADEVQPVTNNVVDRSAIQSPADQPAPTKADISKADISKAVRLTLSGTFSQGPTAPGLWGEIQPSLVQLLKNLQRIGEDTGLAAVVLEIHDLQIGPSQLGEIRRAVQQLRRHGKLVYAELQSATTSDYLVASACDQIVMPESGMLLLPGVRAEIMFYRRLFDKLGIQVDMLQVGDFKGAAEPYARESMSPEFRQQYELVLDDLFDHQVDTIATDRRLPRERVEQLIDQSLFTPAAARSAGLIDHIVYEDELQERMAKSLQRDRMEITRDPGKKRVDADFSGMLGMVRLMEMFTGTSAAKRKSTQPKIAVIHATGMIVSGKSQSSLWGDEILGSDTMVQTIREANADETIKGIVLHIDSPGGSAMASDLIWRAIEQSPKPIVASMGDIAASGGYYIAMGCDYIYAQPQTLTGSIGVVGGKVALSPALEKFGIHTETISRGKHSGLFSGSAGFSESERQVFTEMMQETYHQFVRKGAAGRKMTVERMESLAGGRIWSGRQAVQHGLVDQLGSLDDAIAKVKLLAGIEAVPTVETIDLPEPKNFFEQLLENQSGGLSTSVGTPLPHLLTTSVVPADVAESWREASRMQILFGERVLTWLPYRVSLR